LACSCCPRDAHGISSWWRKSRRLQKQKNNPWRQVFPWRSSTGVKWE
jgi:hypothetical protein